MAGIKISTLLLLSVALIQVVNVFSGPIDQTPKIEQTVDVLILGAGAAGIGAARKLENTTLSYLFLEAADYIGGRIKSQYMTNTDPNLKEKASISAGAQWLHGKANPLYYYAKEKGLVVVDKSQADDGMFIREDGYEFEDEFVWEIEEIVGDILEEAEDIYEDEDEEWGDDYPESLDEYLTSRFERKIILKSKENKIKARQILDWHKRQTAVDNGAGDFKDISAKHWGRAEDIGGKWTYLSLKNGFAEVLQLMAKDLGTDKFLLNKKVEKVSWAEGDGDKQNVLVKCTDGTTYAAKHVITTFSLGVLKHDAAKIFVPPLPETHTDAIKCLGFGPMTKILLQFENKWWEDNAGIQYVYEDTEYGEEEEDFLRYMSGLDQVYTGPSNVLLGWVGDKGTALLEQLSDKEVVDAVIKRTEKFVGHSVPYPKRYFVSRWLNNPLTRGAYSYPSKKCDADEITPKDLAAKITIRHADVDDSKVPRNLPLLQFAGEGSSQAYYSTAHGAYLSGEDAANVIINYNSR